jgi:hypothetical protein
MLEICFVMKLKNEPNYCTQILHTLFTVEIEEMHVCYCPYVTNMHVYTNAE